MASTPFSKSYPRAHSRRKTPTSPTAAGFVARAEIFEAVPAERVRSVMRFAEADIAFAEGRYRIVGTDREIGVFEVFRGAATRSDLPAELHGPLAAVSDQTLPVASFPCGTQICGVDAETGAVEIVGYAAVDDVGRAVNPMIVHGQTHGGIAQASARHCSNTAITIPRLGSCWERA